MSCKLAFQSSCSQWSFRKVGSRWQKNKEQKAKEKKTFPSFLLGLLALEAVVIVVMVIKLQTPMKV